MNKVVGHRVELSEIATSNTHGEDSPYFAGWKAYDEDPYDPVNNPSGVIQMGLAENQVSSTLHLPFIPSSQISTGRDHDQVISFSCCSK